MRESMDIPKIIKAMEDTGEFYPFTGTAAIRRCIQLLEEMTEGYVLVPKYWMETAKCPYDRCNNGIIESNSSAARCDFCHDKALLKALEE